MRKGKKNKIYIYEHNIKSEGIYESISEELLIFRPYTSSAVMRPSGYLFGPVQRIFSIKLSSSSLDGLLRVKGLI